MTLDMIISIVMTIIISATPLLLAGLGELVTEKSGVLNLGLEGLMLIGAVSGFAASYHTGSTLLGCVAAVVAGAFAASLFAFLTLVLLANQVATGLALTIFGTGLSSLIGVSYVGHTIERLPALFQPALATHPWLRCVFGYDGLVYGALTLTFAIAWFLKHTRAGLILRAVGESDEAAHAIGYPVIKIRFLATLFGGALAGLAGAYFSLALTPMWADKLTAGRGWIALALVVFASWRPWRVLGGALLFGAVMTLELHVKAAGFHLVPPEVLAMMPYLATIVVLTIICARNSNYASGVSLAAPASLGHSFKA